ncbi:MAG TPA: XkdF-like putative serine protease domain-containing protein, partial [Marinobacter sp.]|nr:XkdF-like putative serine protease domain-containing protein [Marinobacter sp.]
KSSADTLLFSVDSDTGIGLTATVFADVTSPDVAPSGRIDLDALLDAVYKGVAVLTFAPAESVAASSDSVSLSDNLHTALRTFHGSEAVILRSGVAGMAAKAHNSVTSSSSNEATPALLARKVYGGVLSNLFHSPMLHERNAMGNTKKRMMNDDSFTTSAEAAVRSMELGLNGDIHTHQTADGQATYMPGATHEAYLERMAELAGISDAIADEASDSTEPRQDLLERVISSILHTIMDHEVEKATDILKVDTARRIVWGWASVSTMKGELVTDRQGDRIAPDQMEKMADRFMRSARAAKAMHDGDDVGEVIHSFPLTQELAKAFGIETDREGWITGTYIKSDAEWDKVLKGEYRGLSIGGRAKRRPS